MKIMPNRLDQPTWTFLSILQLLPHGIAVRRLIALFAIGQSLLRINLWQIGNISDVSLSSSFVFDILLLIAGLFLLFTSTKRLTISGRLDAAFMAGIYTICSTMAWPFWSAVYGNILFVIVLLAEAATLKD